MKVPAGGLALENIHPESSALFRNVDLTGVGRMDFTVTEMGAMKSGQIDVYLESVNGEKLGTVNLSNSSKAELMKDIFGRTSSLVIKKKEGRKNLLLVFRNPQAAGSDDLFIFRKIVLNK